MPENGSPFAAPVRGFPQPNLQQRQEVVARPTPLPKRPKGRWFVGVLLLLIAGGAAYQVWNSFFRYRAYGTVTGRVLQVSSAVEGRVQCLYVREGDRVRQGQLLAVLDNLELRQRQAQLADELKIAQASLAAEVAKLKWQAASDVVDRHGRGMAEYYEAWGKLLQEEARLDELQVSLSRSVELFRRQAISRAEYEQVSFARTGQADKVAKLRQAVDELKKRQAQATALLQDQVGVQGGLADQGRDQVSPFVAKIEALQREMTRHQERRSGCQVLAPTNGVIVKMFRFAGEYGKPSDPLLSLLEEGSLEVVLYLPQQSSTGLVEGEALEVVIEPYPEPAGCTVLRVGDHLEAAPEQIKHHYREGEKLLPVYLKPKEELARWMALKVGGVVKLPYRLAGSRKGNEP